ncbi:hypothetical protein KPSA3_03921 [Pseudomonas syringae pv. actinidiae]|uniref:Uncharacterized protein n=1 Tax=Pseudomonas syringae pv. actinidiae TaxID=103796 RepID=A0AAN4Q6H4_PSESF|nr:hypothetical protein KPSA3_03921 [Pseudomonas syringae pv. actinidiae]
MSKPGRKWHTVDLRIRLRRPLMAWLYELGCRESSLPQGGRLDPAGFHPHACALRLPEAHGDGK